MSKSQFVRKVSILGVALALFATAVFPIAGVGSTANADGKGVGKYTGFWAGVDAGDGSGIQASITDRDNNGVAEVIMHDDFWRSCAGGNALTTGSGTVVDGKLSVPLTIQCLDAARVPTGVTVTIPGIVFTPVGGKVLVLSNTNPTPPIAPTTFHRISVGD